MIKFLPFGFMTSIKLDSVNFFLFVSYKVISDNQGFNQALLLTSIFHEGLSFMTVGHNPTCISMLDPCSWGFIWGAVNPHQAQVFK